MNYEKMKKTDFVDKNGNVVISKVLSREVCAKIREELDKYGYSNYLNHIFEDVKIYYNDFEDIDDFYQELANLLDDTIFVNEENTIFTFEGVKSDFVCGVEEFFSYLEYGDCVNDISFEDYLEDYATYECEV